MQVGNPGRILLVAAIAASGLVAAVAPAHAVPPSALVDAAASPASLPPPGGSFTFSLKITNGGQDVTIASLSDSIYGDLDAPGHGSCSGQVGVPISARGTFSCSYTGMFFGVEGSSQTSTVTIGVRNAAMEMGNDIDDVTVRIQTPPPVPPLVPPAAGLAPTGQRAAALAKCKKKKRKARKKCRRKALLLPV